MSATRPIQKGAIDQSVEVILYDAATFLPRTDLVYNTANLVAWYRRGELGTPVQITLATLANAQAAHSDGGFVAVNATTFPGRYRLDLPDAVQATGVARAYLSVTLPGTIVGDVTHLDLVDYDPYAAPPTEIEVADEVWNTALPATYASGEAGAILPAIQGSVDTEVAAIKAKTDNLPSDPADASDIAASFSSLAATLATIAGYIDTEVAAIKAKTDNLPASPANEATLTTIAGYIDTEVAAIKAKTDNLPASPANEATLTTIAGYLDTEIAAIKAQTDLLPSDPADASVVAGLIAAVEAKVDTVDNLIDTEVGALQSDLTAVKAKTDNLPTDPADASVVAGLIAAVEAKVDTLLTSDVAYKRAVAVTGFMFPMRLTAGTPATALTITVQVSKDGGAFANVTAGSGVATEVSGGWYKIDLSGTEMTADEVALKMTGTGCSQTDVKIRTQS